MALELSCNCRTEIRGEEIHVLPCSPEHGEYWDANLARILEELGYPGIPTVTVED